MDKLKERKENAIKMYKDGYNCCQAVLASYCDIYGLDPKMAKLVSNALGGGIGGRKKICGAIVAVYILEGIKLKKDSILTKSEKNELHLKNYVLEKSFEKKFHTTVCKKLKKTENREDCIKYIEKACDEIEEFVITDNYLQE